MSKQITEITTNKSPKNTAYIVGSLLVIFAGYKAYKYLFKKPNDTIDNVGNGSISNSTITKQEAINYAQQLLDAMNVGRNSIFFGGTDEQTISNVFDQIKNSDDFRLIYQAFGLKDYNGVSSPEFGDGIFQNYTERNLTYWLKSELGNFWSWDKIIYNKVKLVVESAGFTF